MVSPSCRSRSTRRQAWAMTLGFVTIFAVGDLFLANMTLPPVYGSRNQSREKWELYNHSASTPEVIYVGCSYEWCGINPRIVDAEVRRLADRRVTSLNLSSSAASALTQFLLICRIVESGRLPQVVYLGVSPSTLDTSHRGWLRNGLCALGRARDLPLAASVDVALFCDGLGPALFRSFHQWGDCQIIAHRLAIAAPLVPRSKLRLDDRGWAEWVGEDAELRRTPSTDVEEPAGVHAQLEIRPDNANFRALRRSIRLLQAAGVTVRLLETPVAPTSACWDDPRRNGVYRNLIDAFADDVEVTIAQPPQIMTTDDFFDPVHLNAKGAAKLSGWLALDAATALATRISAFRPPSLTASATVGPLGPVRATPVGRGLEGDETRRRREGRFARDGERCCFGL